MLSTEAFDDIGRGFALDSCEACEYHYNLIVPFGCDKFIVPFLPWMPAKFASLCNISGVRPKGAGRGIPLLSMKIPP